jgi:hypothetical protein
MAKLTLKDLVAIGDDQLAQMPWEQLINMRATADPEANERIAPFEHRAYAREQVAENPLMAPVYGAMIPGYQGYKALKNLVEPGASRTHASLGQMVQSFQGVGEGLKQWWNRP